MSRISSAGDWLAAGRLAMEEEDGISLSILPGWLIARAREGDVDGDAAGNMAQMNWAHLPVGPLERQLREGIQGGVWEEVHEWTLKKE
jgi:hypothetical protein